MISAITHSGIAQRIDQPSCSTSREVRVSRSPLPAALDHADREAERVLDEVLAELGQHLLTEAPASAAGRSG